MDALTSNVFNELLRHSGKPCLSIYMPTHRTAGPRREDVTRLKNLLREAEDRLVILGLRRTKAKDFLEPARHLLEDESFWTYEGEGLALFMFPGVFRPYRLPLAFGEFVTASDHFHMKPLVPIVGSNGIYYVLSIGKKEVKLFRGTRFELKELELPEGTPHSLADTLKDDVYEKHLNYHAGTGAVPGGRPSVTYHSDEDKKDSFKQEITRYFRALDKHVRSILDNGKAPLVLAGVAYYLPLYREATNYPRLVDKAVEGTPHQHARDELRRCSWKLVEPIFSKSQEDARRAFAGALEAKQALDDPEKVLQAAYQGNIKTLFSVRDRSLWGAFDAHSGRLVEHQKRYPEDDELTDSAISQTLKHGGKAYVVEPGEFPENFVLGAMCRY
jgi:hypothetical protein